MSKGEWLNVITLTEEGPDCIDAEISIPENSEWFSGHFPGTPILPGVALLDVATNVFSQIAAKKGLQPAVVSIKRVKFKSPLEGGANITLKITGFEKGSSPFRFSFYYEKEEICSGQLIAD